MMKKIVIAALLYIVTFNSGDIFATVSVQGQVASGPGTVLKYGYIQLEGGLLCSKIKITPRKSGTQLYLRASTPFIKQASNCNLDRIKPRAQWKQLFDKLDPARKQGFMALGLNDPEKALNVFIQRSMDSRLEQTGEARNCGPFYLNEQATALPAQGIVVAYGDYTEPIRVYVFTSPNYDAEPVDPNQYVIVDTITDSLACIGNWEQNDPAASMILDNKSIDKRYTEWSSTSYNEWATINRKK